MNIKVVGLLIIRVKGHHINVKIFVCWDSVAKVPIVPAKVNFYSVSATNDCTVLNGQKTSPLCRDLFLAFPLVNGSES
jgi:hypothetical protein